jgi:predicted AlkP superfamily phosphohydrolase/phosphomutase
VWIWPDFGERRVTGFKAKEKWAMESGRIFVIGLDAADPDLLDAWIRRGELPFFEELMHEGTYCRLRCIPPTFSPVEWTSILTGTNPGKHGIFGFAKPVNGKVKILNRMDCRSVTFYEILAEAGMRVGLINMVMTYPATPLNGFMITGMETPDLSSPDISYPRGLIEDLRAAGIDYHIGPGISGLVMQGKVDKAVEALEHATDERYKAAKYLMGRYDPDLMVVLFSQIDYCGHYFWRYHDVLHPEYTQEEGARFGDVLLGVYQRHERILRDLMSKYPKATFVICSDHGMGFNYEARYYVKELFARLGWYTPANTSAARFSPRSLLTRQIRNLYWFIFRRFPMDLKQRMAGLFPTLRSRVEAVVADVNWSRTRVYSNDDFCSIVINRMDENGEALFPSEEAFLDFRAEIIARLCALEELGTGQPLVEKVHTRETLYFGDYVDGAPDLIIEWAEVRLRNGIRSGDITILPEEIKKSDLQKILSGEHRPYGILLMKGEMIQKDRRIADGSILDIAPTVLYMAGHPVPQTMDGNVLLEAFCESFRTENAVKFTNQAYGDGHREGFSFSVDESFEIQERLRGLGYIE